MPQTSHAEFVPLLYDCITISGFISTFICLFDTFMQCKRSVRISLQYFSAFEMNRVEFCQMICIETRKAYSQSRRRICILLLTHYSQHLWSYPQQCLCSSSHPLRLSQPLLSSSLHVGIPTVTTGADAAEKPGSVSGSNAPNCASALTESCKEMEQSGGMLK